MNKIVATHHEVLQVVVVGGHKVRHNTDYRLEIGSVEKLLQRAVIHQVLKETDIPFMLIHGQVIRLNFQQRTVEKYYESVYKTKSIKWSNIKIQKFQLGQLNLNAAHKISNLDLTCWKD